MIINKADKILEKATTRLKQGRANSRALHMQNESFKDNVAMLGVKPKDTIAFKDLLQISQIQIQELRHKLKMTSTEHDQSKQLV